MFKFFKDKLKGAVEKFSKSVDEEGEEIEVAEEEFATQEKIFDQVPEQEVEEVDAVELPDDAAPKEDVEEPVEDLDEDEPEEPIEKAIEEEPSETMLLDDEPEKEPVEALAIEDVTDEPEEIAEPESAVETPAPVTSPAPIPKQHVEEEKGFFGKLLAKKIDNEKFEALFFELEVIMLENNVSVEVIDKIKADMKEQIVGKPLKRNKILDIIQETLSHSIKEVLTLPHVPFDKRIETKNPYVVCLLGINGSGKTTSIAKLTRHLQMKGKSVVLAAADTFRAAAIDQLQEHADNLGVKLIKHEYGSDPAAVAFDAIEHAKAKGIDVVLIDTAGRIHSNTNLMNEMKKIIKVANPDMKVFVGESITGNDCVEQARSFNEAVGIDGIILSKADIDEKGGAAISVSYVTKAPIFYMGTGQGYEDLEPFDPKKIMETLGL